MNGVPNGLETRDNGHATNNSPQLTPPTSESATKPKDTFSLSRSPKTSRF